MKDSNLMKDLISRHGLSLIENKKKHPKRTLVTLYKIKTKINTKRKKIQKKYW